MFLRNNIVFSTYFKIKNNLPDFVLAMVWKLSPLYFLSALLEVFGLMTIFPVINVLINPQIIESNSYINFIYNYFNFPNHFSFALFSLIVLTIIFIIKNGFFVFISNIQIKKLYETAARLSDYKYNDYLNRSYLFLLNNNSAVLLRDIVALPFELVTHIVLSFISLINELFIVFLITLIIFIYQPTIFISLLLYAIPAFFLYEKLFKKTFSEFSNKRDKESVQIYRHTQQSIEGYREIKLFNKLSFFKPVFSKAIWKLSNTIRGFYLLNYISPKIIETMAIMSVMAIVFIGYFLDKNLESISQFLIIFSIAAYRLIPSTNKIILNANNIKGSDYVFNYFHNNVNPIVEFQETIEKEPLTPSVPLNFNESIKISGLNFKFPGQEYYVLKDIDLAIEKGSTIGIVGPSGSGKTTLLNIILRLFSETNGGIYVDDVKLNDHNIIEWYNLISYVPQNSIILDGNIIENIAFGIPENKVDYGLLAKVIEQSQLSDFVSSLSENLKTQIGEKGLKISGGQRQRLAIARALYHGGKILIFDEATSALDNSTEELITESIFNLKNENYTTIIVAHRLSTLKYCDHIYRLHEGVLTKEVFKEKEKT